MLEAGTARRKETEPLPRVGFSEKMCDMPAGALVLPGEEGSRKKEGRRKKEEEGGSAGGGGPEKSAPGQHGGWGLSQNRGE